MIQIPKNKIFLCLLSLTISGWLSSVRSQQSLSIEPQAWLILHGGGIETKPDYAHMHRFAALAGGPKASVVVILTPVDIEILTPQFLTYYKQWWTSELGLTDVSFMDTRKREEADTEAFVAPLRKATGVWIMGGHLSNLLDFYLGTRTEREIKAVAERGGVIAGSSAGAMIQGSFLMNVTKTPSGAPLRGSKMYLDAARMVGFGLLRNVAIYPHFSARPAAEKDMTDVLSRYPELLGIAIDERTAIVIHDEQFEVIGPGHVFVFDPKNPSKKKSTLSPGQKFDLRKRVVVR